MTRVMRVFEGMIAFLVLGGCINILAIWLHLTKTSYFHHYGEVTPTEWAVAALGGVFGWWLSRK